MDKLKQFSIISITIFAVIVGSSILFLNKCNTSIENCDFNYIQLLNPIILSFGVIGLIYGLYTIKGFTVKIDKDLLPHYKEILDLELDDDNKKDNNEKILSF